MKMRPSYKDYLWGGDTLITRYGKDTRLRPVAESWEVSCHPDGVSVIDNGEYAGITLRELLEIHPQMSGNKAGEFPILIKLIDANKKLSLQVHPNDEYAARIENQAGKNEMWYIVDCKPDSELIIGLKNPVSRQAFVRSIRENTILDNVNRVKVKPGDCFLIPAGLLHAIGPGILIAEIQQSSNVTYRVYDYNRTGPDGKKRELHIEKAADVINSGARTENSSAGAVASFDGYTKTSLASWEFFSAYLLCVTESAKLVQDENGFSCLLITEGELSVQSGEYKVLAKAGDSLFIPAGLGAYSLNGAAKALLTTI